MLDLGNSFLASVERDPQALAIVDGPVRLSYAQWYRRVSAIVAVFDELGLHPGDHLVTLLQNCWEAATIHWACQFAGIISTPINWLGESTGHAPEALRCAEVSPFVSFDRQSTALTSARRFGIAQVQQAFIYVTAHQGLS